MQGLSISEVRSSNLRNPKERLLRNGGKNDEATGIFFVETI